MKTRYLWMLAVSMLLATTNSSAQNSENSNPYAIFGCTPYVAGDKDAGETAEKVFVIENFSKGSKVARIEHNPQTGRVRLLNKHGKLLKERLLKACENGWLTQDRFAEKYYSISPYAFCSGNPIRFIDRNGDSVVVSGSQQAAAFQQMQDFLGKELSMSMSANGTIIASQKEGVKLSRAGRKAMKAFGSATITVNIVAENTKETSSGNLYVGGAFMGNTVNADGTVTARQEVNPEVLGAMSNAYGKPGQDMMHEVTEAYQGALISQRSGVSSPISNQPGSVYPDAHNIAIPQSGIVKEHYYNSAGKEVQTLSPAVVRSTYTVYPRRQQPVVIMRFP